MITFVLMALSFISGILLGAYSFYKRVLSLEREIYEIVCDDIFSVINEEGYEIMKEGAVVNDARRIKNKTRLFR